MCLERTSIFWYNDIWLSIIYLFKILIMYLWLVHLQDCRQPFQGGSFFDHEGLPYCETHYHAKRGSLCAGCSKPITGRCITAMFKKFHPEHFVCAFCLKQLNKGTFKEQKDKPYCHTCFDKIFGWRYSQLPNSSYAYNTVFYTIYDPIPHAQAPLNPPPTHTHLYTYLPCICALYNRVNLVI